MVFCRFGSVKSIRAKVFLRNNISTQNSALKSGTYIHYIYIHIQSISRSGPGLYANSAGRYGSNSLRQACLMSDSLVISHKSVTIVCLKYSYKFPRKVSPYVILLILLLSFSTQRNSCEIILLWFIFNLFILQLTLIGNCIFFLIHSNIVVIFRL